MCPTATGNARAPPRIDALHGQPGAIGNDVGARGWVFNELGHGRGGRAFFGNDGGVCFVLFIQTALGPFIRTNKTVNEGRKP
jgi:hypothetical protein